MSGTVCTSASVVILYWCRTGIGNIRNNLATVEPRDWLEEELMAQAQEHLNGLDTAVRGLFEHRNKGDRAQ